MAANEKAGSGDWTPDPEQMALWPAISGNTINGLGESERRRPSPIYWHDPSQTPHGPLQDWMARKSGGDPALVEVVIENIALQARPQAPIAEIRVERSDAEWSAAIREFARAHEADLVGIARLDPEWVFEGYEVHHAWMVVLGVAMDHAELSSAPEPSAAVEVMQQYNRGVRAARELADWLRRQGQDADGHSGPRAGPVNLVPAALACGFGELGKHGSIINRELGSSFRLACVLTSVPLLPDEADGFGVDDFCGSCRLCTAACPVDAIYESKRMVRGVEKWYVDFDRCLPFFNEHHGCAICLAVCPWGMPGVAPRLADKMMRRRATRAPGRDASR